MSQPLNRQQFKAYIYRRLGYPVIQINVTDEQTEDRIDDALAFYQDYHYLGSEKTYYIHTVTAQEVIDKKITLPEEIMTVSNILPMGEGIGNNFMSDRYQFLRNEYAGLAAGVSYSIIPYYVSMVRMAELDWLFNSTPSIRFNKTTNIIEIFGDTNKYLIEGGKLIFETQSIIDPVQYSDVWKDRWLKKYATALVKRQWAENLKLYGGAPLMGGITLDAQSMYSEAIEEIGSIEEKLISTGNFPVLDEIA